MQNDFFNVENFSCGYPGFKLEKISFGLKKASFTGIIGPNGSGKTTLFRGITQSLPTLVGSIKLNNRDLRTISTKVRAQHIAIVSQFQIYGKLSVKEYVLMGRLPYHKRFQFFETDKDREIAEHYMQLTDVFSFSDKKMNELSGGEMQRASIARALTQEPELLLLDEPTAHLDITHQVRILDLLRRLNNDLGLTVLMVNHDLNLASEYCDQLILINKGKISTKGSPLEVLNFETIEQVYKTPVITRVNPYSGKPVVFLISKKMLQKENTNPKNTDNNK